MFGGGDFVLESSRRARGFATWAALRALDVVDVVSDVVLNQVLVRVGDEALTNAVERRVQKDGACRIGATRRESTA